MRSPKCKLIFAGSSEEYGLQFKDWNHLEAMRSRYGMVEPPPKTLPELPIDENGFFRPMSPYATSKIYGDYAFRSYNTTYGMETVVSRAFNHEGAGRGHNFVTSTIVRQLVAIHLEEQRIMTIGDVQTFRDWSHVNDIVEGYLKMAERADGGSVYVQGSGRTNSVLSYILYTIEALGYEISQVRTFRNEKGVRDPLSKSSLMIGDSKIDSNKIDDMLISNALNFELKDEGIIVDTKNRSFKIQFDPKRFRQSDVPILLANAAKIKEDLGVIPCRQITDIITNQVNYYLDPEDRINIIDESYESMSTVLKNTLAQLIKSLFRI